MRFPGFDPDAGQGAVFERLGRDVLLRRPAAEAEKIGNPGFRMKPFFVLCVLCASVVICFALDRDAFTFTRYDLNLRIEPEQQRLAARGKITLRNDSASPQKNAALQISSSLSWRSIQWHGKALQFVPQPYESDIDHTGQLSEAIRSEERRVGKECRTRWSVIS